MSTQRWRAARERVQPRLDELAARRDALRQRVTDRATTAVEASPAPVRTALRLGIATVRDAMKDRVPGLAAEVALFTLISLPALVLVVLGSLGYVAEALGEDGQEELERLVFTVPSAAMSDSTYAAYESLVRPVLESGRVDVIGIGLLLGLWTGSRAMNRILETITIAYDLPPRASRGRTRLLALGLTVAGLLGAVTILPLLVLGPRLIRALAPDGIADATLQLLDWAYWPAMGALVIAALATLYHVGVPWQTPWRRDLPGAVLAMALWLAAAAGLRAYLFFEGSSIEGGEQVYQQLGTPIAVVLWLWVSAIAVLLGAELNAEIEKEWPTRTTDSSVAG
ncbi:YihY/virulence factor BrkB family protein [Janibacter alkaliphilus]|uniref:Membrane protein n=1 Tax=Janibacter alkaliphilus TaxID=1069963 RepID=A0A852XE30_9MICO|nr:YihY/virulence factor BrkB family protein [Janibacter alkaliphilus]NYG36745.1 membrane protein [Janibacter alkaliphilus]